MEGAWAVRARATQLGRQCSVGHLQTQSARWSRRAGARGWGAGGLCEADVDADEEVVDASGTAPEDETPGDSVRKLEMEILYSDEPNWDEINSKAALVGRDTSWVQRLKEKRINTQVALDQVRQDSPIETSTAEIIRHLTLRSNPLLVCPQVESAKTHAEVLGIDPGAAEDAKARSFRRPE